MKIITRYSDISRALRNIKLRREGFVTNFYFGEAQCDVYIKEKLLFSVSFDKCMFVLRKELSFYHLYFMAAGNSVLDESLQELVKIYPNVVFVTDIIGLHSAIGEYITIFENNEFYKHKRLFRMSRTETPDTPQWTDNNVRYATYNHAPVVYALLMEYFDVFGDQIPLISQLNEWIYSENILITEENERLTGFLIFEINGKTAHLRYWFTHPEYRNKKIGSALLRRFLLECKNTKRQLFWVADSNEDAISRYMHYGFRSEELFDQIMIRRQNDSTRNS
jgi:GNAT superfamily N-acetyltransferase